MPSLPYRLSRREWLAASAIGVSGLSGSGWLDVLATRAAAAEPARRRYKSCIVLWMAGGMSQLDSFDMKPEAPQEYRSPFKPIATAVPGVHICELMPRLAAQMQDLAIIRSISQRGGHGPGARAMHQAGFVLRQPGVAAPNVGAVVSAGLAPENFGIPTHIVISKSAFETGGAGFLGPRHSPMNVVDPAKGLESLKAAVDLGDFQEQFRLFEELEQGFAQRHRLNVVQAHQLGYQNAATFMQSSQAKAFDVSREPDRIRDRYGRNQFGSGCLLARRLVEIGIPFIEVKWQIPLRPQANPSGSLAWDMHEDVTSGMNQGLPIFDSAFSALIADFKDRGMLDSTLIVCMGEMGRTPKFQGRAGRDHFETAWSIQMAGGGIKTGQVIGRTSSDGMRVEDRPIDAAELLATVCHLVGVDPNAEYGARDGLRMDATRSERQRMMAGNPVRVLSRDAKIIRELLA